MNGRNVSVETIAFGNTWRIIIFLSDKPSALAARTKSKFRARRNSARTTPTNPIQLKSSINPNSHQKLGSTTLAKIINR